MSRIEQTPNSSWAFQLDGVNNWAYWDNAFTKDECETIIRIGESKVLEKASVIGDSEEDDKSRDSQIAWLSPSDDMEWVYRRVTDQLNSLNDRFFKFDIFGILEGMQFTRYDAPSGFYGMHMDKVFNGLVRKLSVTIQLSKDEDYEGGEFAFHRGPYPTVMEKDQGKLIAFPSYMVHEVMPVTRGTRYSLVCWVAGKPFT